MKLFLNLKKRVKETNPFKEFSEMAKIKNTISRVKATIDGDKEAFKPMGELPEPQAVNEITQRLKVESEATRGTANEKTEYTEGVNIKVSQKSKAKPEPIERVKKYKPVTSKGTVLQNLMINADLLKEVKRVAFTYDKKMSDIINDLIENYLHTYESDIRKQK